MLNSAKVSTNSAPVTPSAKVAPAASKPVVAAPKVAPAAKPEATELNWQPFGTNLEVCVDGDMVMFRFNASKRFGLSSTGKSIMVSSTSGNKSLPGLDEVKAGINIYVKA